MTETYDNEPRVIMSLTQGDVENLYNALYARPNDFNDPNQSKNWQDWLSRLERIRDHFNDTVDIHYTNLG